MLKYNLFLLLLMGTRINFTHTAEDLTLPSSLPVSEDEAEFTDMRLPRVPAHGSTILFYPTINHLIGIKTTAAIIQYLISIRAKQILNIAPREGGYIKLKCVEFGCHNEFEPIRRRNKPQDIKEKAFSVINEHYRSAHIGSLQEHISAAELLHLNITEELTQDTVIYLLTPGRQLVSIRCYYCTKQYTMAYSDSLEETVSSAKEAVRQHYSLEHAQEIRTIAENMNSSKLH